MEGEVNRRNFLGSLGVTVGATLASAGGAIPIVGVAHAQDKPKGTIPDKPFKIGHMTFFTGPAAVLGEPMFKGQQLAAEEINATGGLLGKRKIELLKADENAGTDANVKELRRLKLSENIDFFCGITSSGNTPALGPVAEELKVLTMFVDGCTDFLFDKAVPNPHYVFRTTNIQSADGCTTALAIVQTWPKSKRIAHIHPDYSYGRNAFDHLKIVMKKLMPQAEIVSEGWPKLGTTDFSSHITKAISSKPDLIVSSVWGGDYVALYKQALRYGMFEKAKFATTLALAPYAGWLYTACAAGLWAWFLLEAHRLQRRVARMGDGGERAAAAVPADPKVTPGACAGVAQPSANPAPMRLFHLSIAYLTLLFAVIAVTSLLPWGSW